MVVIGRLTAISWIWGLAALIAAPCIAQEVVLESAQLGTTGRVGGTSITSADYVGWRFATSVPLAIEQVGGHMLANPDSMGDIFAALIRLPSLEDFPDGAPFSETELVASTTFRPSFPSADTLTPLTTTLLPGSYALLFGSGLFEATGEAALHKGTDQPDIPPTDTSSFIVWGETIPGQPPQWRINQVDHLRFVVTGQETGFPADFDKDGDVDSNDLLFWTAAYANDAAADVDGDADSDARRLSGMATAVYGARRNNAAGQYCRARAKCNRFALFLLDNEWKIVEVVIGLLQSTLIIGDLISLRDSL